MTPGTDGFRFDTWARQRATVAHVYSEAWEEGFTDWDKPDLWKQLDVQMHLRFDGEAAFSSRYVDFLRRDGNNARYSVPLRSVDRLGRNTITDPASSPAVTLTKSGPDDVYVSTSVAYYFTVNDVELRPAPTPPSPVSSRTTPASTPPASTTDTGSHPRPDALRTGVT